MSLSALRRDRLGPLGLLLALLLLLAAGREGQAGPAAAAAPGIMPLSAVRPGMTGYGLTVFKGTQPERFAVRVVGILRQHLPGMDIIVIESDDPRLLHSGIAAGMSGSPIYIEGRLIGALAYGWLFAKDAVAGVTPIEYMIRDLRRPLRPVGQTGAVSSAGDTTGHYVESLPDRRTLRAMLGEGGAAGASEGLGPLVPPRPDRLGDGRLTRAALPLSVAGLSERAIADLRLAFAPYNLVPVQASGAGASATGGPGPAGFEPGGPLAVELIRGDLSAAGTGTVTYVEGSRVAAFGHQLLNAGELVMPISTAEIVTILASQMSSFKMSFPLAVKGALIQDRQAGIVGDTGLRAPTVPLQVAVRTVGADGRSAPTEQTFRTELASHRFLTAPLAQSVVTSALTAGAPDVSDAVIEIGSRLSVRGFTPLEMTDFYYAAGGVSDKMVFGSTGVKQLADLLNNPFAPVQIDRLELRIAVTYRADAAEVVGVALPGDEIDPDTRPSLLVTVRQYGGATTVRALPIEIPRWLAGQSLKIEAAAGPLVKPEVAPPDSLGELVENLRKGYSARTLVVTLYTTDDGVMLRGRLLPNLPASVIATLRPGGASRRGEPYKRVSRLTFDLGTVLGGKQETTVLVRDELR